MGNHCPGGGNTNIYRVRLLREEPYTQKEAEAAAGIGVEAAKVAKAARTETEGIKPMEEIE